MATRSRRYAEAAYQCVRKHSEGAQQATYKRFAKRFPALALQCGLAQAVAFAHAKGHTDFLEDLTAVAALGGYDLSLMSADAADGLLNDGRNLVIVALVGTDLHIRIFDANGQRAVDKAENELISAETLMALKKQLNPLPDESGLSQEQKQKLIRDATLIAGHTPRGSTWEKFAQQTRTEDMQGYQRLTRETLAAAAWLKRYAEALLEDPDNDDAGADEADIEGSPPTSGMEGEQ